MKLRAFSLASAFLFAVTACQAGAPQGPSPSGPAAVEFDPNGVLRVASTTVANSFDPIRAATAGDISHLINVYDTLVYIGVNDDPEPMLATSWKFNDSPPSLDLTLRTDVTFSTGAKFDANVVKANIERAKGPTSLLATSISQIAGVTVIDASHVRLNLTGPAPDLPLTLADRAGVMVDPAMFSSPELATKGFGSGPYTVESYKPGAEVIYKRRAGYWDPKAAPAAEVRWLQIDNADARYNALTSGQADLLNLGPALVQRAKSTPTIKVLEREIQQTEHMKFNTAKSEFGKQAVRQAINYAIDRKTIVRTLLADTCTATSQYALPGSIMYNPSITADYWAYNPQKAKDLLKEAGLPDGFTFTTVVVNQPAYLPYAQAMQAQLAQVGIKMNLVPTPSADIVNAFYVRKTGDAIISGDLGSASPTQLALDNYLPTGTRNPGGQSTPQIEDLVKKVSTTSDEAQRKTYWGQLTKAITDYAFSVQLCQRKTAYATSLEVEGFKIAPTGGQFVRGVGIKKKA